MRKNIEKKIEIPEGIKCSYKDFVLTCTKDSSSLQRKISIPGVEVKIEKNDILLTAEKGNKNSYKKIVSSIAHIKNSFAGLQEQFVYNLEVVYIHFPISLKIEGGRLTVNNFFGEKKPRSAKILPNVEVEITGQKIKISSANKEAAGQTAANFEKVTRVRRRDKRIYQDGIYILEKPHGGKSG